MKRLGRLRRALLALLVLLACPAIARGDDVKAQVMWFADNGANYIVTSTGAYDGQYADRFSAGAKITVDAISAATPNTRKHDKTETGLDGATLSERRDRLGGFVGGYSADDGSGFFSKGPDFTDQRRLELSGYVGVKIADSSLKAGYIYSNESYYTSHTVYGTFEQSIAMENTVLTATYFHNFDSVDTSDDEVAKALGFPKPKGVDGVNLGWTQVLSRRTIAQLVAGVIFNAGYLADPERDVFADLGADTWGIKVERLPNRRVRCAGSARLIQQFWRGSATELGYRYYFDDWGIDSHTGTLRFSQYIAKWLPVTLHGRYYTQSESDYTRLVTDGTQEYYTASPNLQAFDSVMAGIKLSAIGDHNLIKKAKVTLGAGFDYYWQSDREGVADGYRAVMVHGNLNFEW